jgi:hypothetical protein
MFSTGKRKYCGVSFNTRYVFSTLCLLAMVLYVAPPGGAQVRNLVVTQVEPASRVSLAGHHPAWASIQNDTGAVPADLPLGQLELVLARSPGQQQAFDQFLQEQLDPASPNYHHWLTPVEIGERFGASQHDLDSITNWLQSQNLHLDSIANSRVRIEFSGTALTIWSAFGAEMHYYLVDGEQRLSIAAEPQIPTALASIIKSISGLYTTNIRPLQRSRTFQVPVSNIGGGFQGGIAPDATLSNGAHIIFPADFATIYDLNNVPFNGAGQTIAVIGRSRVYAQDITNFQTLAGLAPHAPTVIIPPNGVDPGPAQTSPPTSGGASMDQVEATLDVTRTSSIAPGATIDLVVSSGTNTTDGVTIATKYVVDTTPVFAHIMTISFGACESTGGQSAVNLWDSLFSQAAAEGISVFVSSGDSGAAGCDIAFVTPPFSQILSPNYICVSSHATCVGGTEFADLSNPTKYWATINSATFESALSYIPEGGWNDPRTSSGNPVAIGSGGGVSAYIPTPSWQTGTGVPGTRGRYTPDIAFSASLHDGYFLCSAAAGSDCVIRNGSFILGLEGGTSAAAPDMAGITALLNQKSGLAQGELNSNLYRLAATPSKNVFHDVTVTSSAVSGCSVTIPSMCNNSIPSSTSQTGGLSGYLVGTGYDEVTGLGSIDVANLLANWGVPSTTTVATGLSPVFVGASVTFTAIVNSLTSGTPTGTVTFLDNGTIVGTSTLNSSALATLNTSAFVVGTHSITAQYGGDSIFAVSTSSAISEVVNVKPTTSTVTSSLNPSIGGQSVTFTATVSNTIGGTPTGQVMFVDGSSPMVPLATLNASGVATLVSSLNVAAHSVTVRYLGDASFATSTSTAVNQSVDIAGFAPPSSATVVAGQNAVISLTSFQAVGSNLTFQLTCAGLPAKTACTFSPNSVTPGPPPTGTMIQLTLSTSNSELPASPSNRNTSPWETLRILAALATLLMVGIAQLGIARPRRLAFGVCLRILALSSVLIGCGGGSPSTPYTGTPKGTATFTVTGTSGTTTISTPVTVTVQ